MFSAPTVAAPWKVLLIGEAPGEEEEKSGVPFVGASGRLLNDVLQAAGFSRDSVYITNVFSQRPPDNDLKTHWTVTKTELKKLGYPESGRLPTMNKRYLLPQYEPHVARLHGEIRRVQPDLIICLGGWALWAITGSGKIGNDRGNFFQTPFGVPGIASFHPANVLRQWDNLPILALDLQKANRLLRGVLPPPTRRKFWINPTLAEIETVYHRWQERTVVPSDPLGVDVETDPRIDQITTVQFGFYDEAICIPFFDKYTTAEKCNYWATAEEETEAWLWVMRFATLPHRMVGQNFLYDHQYLLEHLDIRIPVCDDTSVLQHSMQPELQKSLGFLASVYLNEPSWKFMRLSSKDENKADD